MNDLLRTTILNAAIERYNSGIDKTMSENLKWLEKTGYYDDEPEDMIRDIHRAEQEDTDTSRDKNKKSP